MGDSCLKKKLTIFGVVGGEEHLLFLFSVPYVIFHRTPHIELFGNLIAILLLNATPTDFRWLTVSHFSFKAM